MVGRNRRGGNETEDMKKLMDLKPGDPSKTQEDPADSMYDDKFTEKPDDSSDEEEPKGGRRRRRTLRIPKGVHVKAKTLKRMLKSKGLKTTGKKSTLRSRARKAHLIRGGGK